MSSCAHARAQLTLFRQTPCFRVCWRQARSRPFSLASASFGSWSKSRKSDGWFGRSSACYRPIARRFRPTISFCELEDLSLRPFVADALAVPSQRNLCCTSSSMAVIMLREQKRSPSSSVSSKHRLVSLTMPSYPVCALGWSEKREQSFQRTTTSLDRTACRSDSESCLVLCFTFEQARRPRTARRSWADFLSLLIIRYWVRSSAALTRRWSGSDVQHSTSRQLTLDRLRLASWSQARRRRQCRY